jgi:hypothetical protein
MGWDILGKNLGSVGSLGSDVQVYKDDLSLSKPCRVNSLSC